MTPCLCQFCGQVVKSKEVTHDGEPAHASCLFAHIASRSIVRRIQRESLAAHKAVEHLKEAIK